MKLESYIEDLYMYANGTNKFFVLLCVNEM